VRQRRLRWPRLRGSAAFAAGEDALPKKKQTAGPKSTSSTRGSMKRDRREAGTGALCAEAQADGVPCFELGRECATCERAKEAREDA
jgi:hypothetical protein